MKRRKLHVVWLWGLLFLMTACGDDDYYYPSVKLEFVTVEAGEDGRIQTLIPDKGEVLTVSVILFPLSFNISYGRFTPSLFPFTT